MAYARNTLIATQGDIGKGGLANSKTIAYMNEGETPLIAGRFVALSPKGVKALTAKTDIVAGVVVRSILKDDWVKGDVTDVMHIGTADSIWVEVAEGETVERGDKVTVVAVPNGKKQAGTIQATADETNGITTDYVVITASAKIAEISRL